MTADNYGREKLVISIVTAIGHENNWELAIS